MLQKYGTNKCLFKHWLKHKWSPYFAMSNIAWHFLFQQAREIEELPQLITMHKEATGHNCNACNKSFRRSEDLDKHIADKHEEKQCLYCDKMCRNEADLVKHNTECIEHGNKSSKCNKCDEKFTNFALRRHKEMCQGKQEYDCPECGQICTTALAVKKHYDSEHKFTKVSSREVCFHWKKGKCTNTNC